MVAIVCGEIPVLSRLSILALRYTRPEIMKMQTPERVQKGASNIFCDY
jgi:hypothetical protein